MNKLFKLLVAGATVVACTLALFGCASGNDKKTVVVSEGDSMPTITVTANSEVKVVPDKAEIGVSVTTQAATAQDTQDQNTTAVNAVIEALAQLGIDETSIQTTDTWLNPRYDYSGAVTYTEPAAAVADSEVTTEAAPAIGSDTSTNIVGYEMTTRLSISDLNIDQVGETISACIAAGANNTDGIRYYSSKYDATYQEALTAAVEAARAKAEVLASAGGVSLGSVYSITEGYQNTAYRYDTGAAMESAVADSAMKVMPGEVNVSASVTVSYEIA